MRPFLLFPFIFYSLNALSSYVVFDLSMEVYTGIISLFAQKALARPDARASMIDYAGLKLSIWGMVGRREFATEDQFKEILWSQINDFPQYFELNLERIRMDVQSSMILALWEQRIDMDRRFTSVIVSNGLLTLCISRREKRQDLYMVMDGLKTEAWGGYQSMTQSSLTPSNILLFGRYSMNVRR